MNLPAVVSGAAARRGVLVALALLTTSEAQMQPRARVGGEWFPVLLQTSEVTYVLKDGKKRKCDEEGIDLQPADSFGPGSVTISHLLIDYDPMRRLSPKERATAAAKAFRFEADVTAAQDLENCYALLPYMEGGSIGTQLFPLGKLSAGKPKHVLLELENQVDEAGLLHVFSQTKEIISNQVSKPYNLHEYFASLRQKAPGVPALTLCKSAQQLPLSLSDTGDLLAMVRDRETKYVVMVVDLRSMAVTAEVEVAPHADEVSALKWISDNELGLIAGYQLKKVDLATRTCTAVLDNVLAVLGTQKDRPWLMEVLRFPTIWDYYNHRAGSISRFDFHRSRNSQEESMKPGRFMVDEFGNVRLHEYYDGDQAVYRYRSGNHTKWTMLDDTVRQTGVQFGLRAGATLDRKIEILSIAPGASTLYVSTRLDSDKFQVATYDVEKGVVGRTIARDPDYDLAESDAGGTQLLYRKRGSELIGMVFDADRPRVVWLDPRFAKVQAAIDRQFPDHVNVPIDWSVLGDTFLYRSWSDQDPGTIYVFRPFEGKLIPVFAASAALADRKLAKTLPFDFRSRDGAVIHAYVTYPAEAPATPPPLVVYVHGGPALRDTWRFDPMNQFLATRGYAVLQVNYRGSSGYGAAYQAAGLRSRLDTVVLDDLADGARFLIEAGKVDPWRVAMIGGSFGGWATYMSLIKYPDLYRAGVAIAAVSHWKDLQGRGWGHGNDASFEYWQAILGGENFNRDEKFIDPLLRAAELRQPIYIMHGGSDSTVPFNQANEMVAKLRMTNPDVRYMSFYAEGHSGWSLANQVIMLNETGAFLKRTLAAAKP